MSKAGNGDTHCVCVEISSFGVFSPEKNPGYANKIHNFLNEKLKIPSDRSVPTVNQQKSDNVFSWVSAHIYGSNIGTPIEYEPSILHVSDVMT